jgi:hypothetical protein
VVRNEIVVPAPADRVWDLLTDVAAWPTWYRACRWVRVESTESSGRAVAFRWKAHPVELRTSVTVSDRPRTFAFLADTPGIHAERTFTLRPTPDGSGTIVVSDETQVGPLAWLGRAYLGPRLRAANQTMFEDLVRAAVHRAPAKAA